MIELGKLNSSSIWEQLWRTGANELHYEAKEDDETLDVSEMVVCIFNAYIYMYILYSRIYYKI